MPADRSIDKSLREPQAAYQSAAPSEMPARTQPDPATPGAVVLGPQRRIVLPAAVTHHLGVGQGDRIIYFFDRDGSIRLRSEASTLDRLRGIFKDLAPERSPVDELIAERREEARREEAGL